MYNYSPLGKYLYKRLPMVISNTTYIFQQKMNDLFHEFELIREYIDHHLLLTDVDCTYHIQKLEYTKKIKEKGFKCNNFLIKAEMIYLGFWVTCCGENPQ